MAIVTYARIREDQNSEDPLESRKRNLTFKAEIIKQSLLNAESNLNDEKSKNLFNEIALKVNYKLFRIFDEEFNEQNPQFVKNSIRDFIYYYLKIKEDNKENVMLFDNVKQEIVLQIYRHLNRNEFTESTLKIKTIFGFFYVFSFYFEISPTFQKMIKALIEQK